MRKILSVALLWMACVVCAFAANVTVEMNSVSTTMSVVESATGTPVAVGTPSGAVYNFMANPGTYIMTAYGTDGTTINGTLSFEVQTADVSLKVITITAYATNSGWAYGTDYTIESRVITRDGDLIPVVVGNSVTAGRATVLALHGASYFLDFVPTAPRLGEGFTTGHTGGTLTANVNSTITMKKAKVFSVIAPLDATVFVGYKTAHYIAYHEIESDSIIGNARYYTLSESGEFNYRVSRPGSLTQAGIFNTSSISSIEVTEADLAAKSPLWIDHDVNSNGGGNVADLFLNINPQEHLKLAVGQGYDVLALRNWQAINTTTGNYFFEPDYHYFVTDVNGVPSSSVVTMDADGTLHAVGNGTAIVTITYDALHVTGSNGDFYHSAIWPENTGVFVVTVGDPASEITLGMTIHEENDVNSKLAGIAYDADFDVFYFPDTLNACHYYTFHPTNVVSVEVAYPTIGTNSATYSGFKTQGVTFDSETGDYTVRVIEGRQIVRLTNASGVSEYQVLVGKPVHIETIVAGRSGAEVFYPGDVITVQLSGLFHPANKLSGIHNFGATTNYHHNGTKLKSSSSQYNFCSNPKAQAVTVTLPDTMTVNQGDVYVLDSAFINVSGFGDPIGNHRNTSKKTGRGANFTALQRNANFGYLPVITLPLAERPNKDLTFVITPAEDTVILTYNGQTLTPDNDGIYHLFPGDFAYRIIKQGHHTLVGEVSLTEQSPAQTTVNLAMTAIDKADTRWDGVTTEYQPELSDGWYLIRSGYHMAWFANQVNAGSYTIKGRLMNDISLADYPWTPVGGTSATKAFKGQFDGQNYTISGLYINATTTYQGLFGYVQNGTIQNLTVQGNVTSTANYAAGIAAYLNASTMTDCCNRVTVHGAMYVAGLACVANGATTINRCANLAEISGTGNYVGGITTNAMNANVQIKNCYNIAPITGANYVAGISGHVQNASATIQNVYNIGKITATGANAGSIRGHNTNGNISNIYSNCVYGNDTIATVHTVILSDQDFAHGMAAHLLGAPFGQKIDEDTYPVISNDAVYQFNVAFNADTTISYVNQTTLPDTVWIKNIYGAYFNSNGEKVLTVNADTAVTLMIDVKPLAGPATFEERTLKAETAWQGDPDFENEDNYWTSGDYIFSTYVMDYGSYGTYYFDVTMSNLTNTTYSPSNPYYDQYSAAGCAAEGQNYAVWYAWGQTSVQLQAPTTISGMAVTNTTWVIDAIRNGDGMSSDGGQPFGLGDWLKLTVKGFDDDEELIGSVDFYLADFRDSITRDWTYVENWQWLELSSLGEVSYLGFSITSTKRNSYGTSTPTYFCFDNLGGEATDCRLGELTHVHGELPTGVDGTSATMPEVRKVLRNGILYIIMPDGRRLDAQGRLVE